MAATWGLIVLIFIATAIAGIVVAVLGFRGRAVFTSPRCAKCSYDLRAMNFMAQQVGTCPECGADLNRAGAVTFGRLQRRPMMITIGVVMLALTALALVLVPLLIRNRAMVSAVGPQASQARSTPALIKSLSGTMNQPWDWQELSARFGAGSLTTSDVDAALNALIAHVNANRTAGRPQQPLHWAETFLKPVVQRGAATPQVLTALCQAYYGAGPQIKSRNRARQGQPMEFEINLEGPWNLPDMQVCWALKEIKADDGSILTPISAYDERSATAKNPDRFSGTNLRGDVRVKVEQALSPGEHELSYTFDLGTVPDRATFRGLDGKPGTPDKWPTPIAKWQVVVKQKVKIVPPEQSIVDPTTDPAEDPFKRIKLSVDQALVRPSSRGVEIVIKWAVGDYADPPISYHVTAIAGDQKIDFGNIFTGKTGTNSSSSSMNESKVVKSLPADITTIDLLLTPDPKNAERFLGVERIWGGEFKLEKVPLQRFDLPQPK